MTDAVAILVFLVALAFVALGRRSYVASWLLYAFAARLTIRAVERALDEGPTAQRIGAMTFYAVIAAAWLYFVRTRGPRARE